MATVDKEVGSLPEATALNDDSLLVMEQNGEAMHFKGKVIKDWVEPYSTAAQNAYSGVKQALDNLPEGDTLIINDLTTGGVSAALSAEQGKVLKQNLDTHAQTLNSHASRHASGGADPITPAMIGAMDCPRGVISDVDILEWVETQTHSIIIAVASTVTSMPFDGAFWVVEVHVTSGSWKMVTATHISAATTNAYFAKYENAYINGMWNGWTKMATTDYAVNKAGDTMTGALTISKGDYEQIGMMSSAGNYGIIEAVPTYIALDIRTSGKDNANRRVLSLATSVSRNIANALSLCDVADGVYVEHSVLHTGNKPFGSYTGNGDATYRGIDTGGIGTAISIWRYSDNIDEKEVILATPTGALYAKGSTLGFTPGIGINGAGVIVLLSATIGNVNGATYNYQVL